ncbi:LysR substrate-binding domain-containing protein [Thalassovita aquimarina]|uniref:LysR family transcriptional regulator n=1 Tax=Thalassovita aquimarina TaxID=2785917 RepID=A0ABS5HWT4_9RHOB|nr:LysR substrate-binding domain-containing protein [Thalassovita aquimarina]MBR9653416.1 LysR family transcriptional regulator [Thalassovita aquimarina]
MIAPRRFLPSISSLLALEAVARLGTATAAANELALTHSAVSRQLKVLEEQLGIALFERRGQGLALTPSGIDYANSVRDCLESLARASLKIKANPSGGSLSLATLPTFGTYWLAPKLRQFSQQHTEVTVNLGTRLAPFDFNREQFDAAIHFGRRDWQGVEYLELARERVVPICSPDLVAKPPVSAQQLIRMPLLHLESRPGAWEDWFEHHACPAEKLHGMLFDQFATMAEAAALGFGVALLPEFFAKDAVKDDRLVRAFKEPMELPHRYYLVWPKSVTPRAPLEQLVNWLSEATDPDLSVD